MMNSTMTSEEKVAAAEKIRATNFIEPIFNESHLAWQDKVRIEDDDIPTSEGKTHVFIHRAKTMQSEAPLTINIHGGGFVRPHMPCNRYFSAKIAAMTKGVVVDVDYKLAPEYPFPVAFNECYDIAVWTKKHAHELGCSEKRIILCGHSAGASLVLAVNMKGHVTSSFEPRLQVLDFGAFDLSQDPAQKKGADTNVISVERMRMFTYLYTNDDPKVIYSPYVSPFVAPDDFFYGMPETLIITAGRDSLKEEAELLGQRIAAQGSLVTIKRFTESVHGFTVQCTGEWEQSQQLIIDTILRACS